MFKKSTLISSLIPLAVLSIFASITGVRAESTESTTNIYQVTDAYKVEIPAEVSVNPDTKTGNIDVKTSLVSYSELHISITSSNSYELKRGDEDKGLDYELESDNFISETKYEILDETFNLDDEEVKTRTNEIRIVVEDEPTITGTYKDTLTFTLDYQSKKKYTLTFDANGGTLDDSALSTKKLACKEAYGELPKVNRENCTFRGWYKEEKFYDMTEPVTANSIMEDADTTVYAQWGGTWKVYIDPNGGDLYVKDKNIIKGASEENPIKTGKTQIWATYQDGAFNSLLIEARKTGYTCTGYFDAINGGTKVWTAVGGSIDNGIYYAAIGGSKGHVWVNTSKPQDSSFTFYPQWEANTYTVEYNPNTTDIIVDSPPSSSHTYGEEKVLSPNGFEREGYTFSGWNTEPNGSGTSYSDGQSVINLTSENNGKVILYAIWKETSSLNENVNNTEPSDEQEEATASIQEDFISDESDLDVSLNEQIIDSNSDNTEAEDANVETESQSVGQTEPIEESIEPEQLVTEEEIEKATAGE